MAEPLGAQPLPWLLELADRTAFHRLTLTTDVTAFFTADSSSTLPPLIPPRLSRPGRRAAERGAEFRGRGGDGARLTQILRGVCQPQRTGRAVK